MKITSKLNRGYQNFLEVIAVLTLVKIFLLFSMSNTISAVWALRAVKHFQDPVLQVLFLVFCAFRVRCRIFGSKPGCISTQRLKKKSE